jgi:hypothetical protein
MRLPLGREPLGLELGAERLEAEWLRSFHSIAMTLQHSLVLIWLCNVMNRKESILCFEKIIVLFAEIA